MTAPDDWGRVKESCITWQESLSARADGEPIEVSADLLDAHVRRCRSCQAFAASLDIVPRAMPPGDRVGESRSQPTIAAAVAEQVAAADRRSVWQVARWGLAVVAVQVIAFAIPDLAGRDSQASVHNARHLGAFTLAYGVALLVVVARPARARTVLPVAAMLSAALALTAVIDMATGHAPFVNELGHLPELASLGLLWLVQSPYRRPRRGAVDAASAAAPLRAVDRAVDRAG